MVHWPGELCALHSAQTVRRAVASMLRWYSLQTRMEDRLPAYDVRLEGRSLLAEPCVDFPCAQPLLHLSSRVIRDGPVLTGCSIREVPILGPGSRSLADQGTLQLVLADL